MSEAMSKNREAEIKAYFRGFDRLTQGNASELSAEVERLREEVAVKDRLGIKTTAVLLANAGRITELKTALGYHGVHEEDCAWHAVDGICDCGLGKALKGGGDD